MWKLTHYLIRKRSILFITANLMAVAIVLAFFNGSTQGVVAAQDEHEHAGIKDIPSFGEYLLDGLISLALPSIAVIGLFLLIFRSQNVKGINIRKWFSNAQPKAYFATAFIIALLPVILFLPLWYGYGVLILSAGEGHTHGGEMVDLPDFLANANAYVREQELPDGSIQADHAGHNYIYAGQYFWYPNGAIRMEVGETYEFMITSVDVVHGFSLYMGDTSYNTVLVPNLLAEVEITPIEAGEYLLFCTEYCGMNHDLMNMQIIVEG